MKLDKSQILPFPLSEHLAMYISSQLESPIEMLGENLNISAKYLHINRSRPLGKMILRCLEATNKPQFITEGFCMYISTSKNAGNYDKKIVSCRSQFVQLSAAEISDITDIFETLFRTEFIAFVDGAHFGNDLKKGKVFKAIIQFLEKYNLAHDGMAVERYRKLYSRSKNTHKALISRFL